MKKEVLIVTDNYVGEPGGSEKHLLNLLSGIDEEYNVQVFQMFRDKHRNTQPDGKLNNRDNVNLLSWPVQSVFSWSYWSLIFKLFRIIRKNNVQILLSYHEKADLLNYILSHLFFRHIVSLSSKRDMGFSLSSRLKKLMIFISGHFDGIISSSSSIGQMLVAEYGVNPDRSWVVHNGTNLDLYRKGSTQETVLLKARLNLPSDKKIICSVGSLKPIKGHTFLLQGFSRYLAVTKSDAILVLIGEGEEESKLKALATTLGVDNQVIFAGLQKNVSEWMKAADLFVISSLSEGLSNALVEASAAGLPLLATDVGGNGEVVENEENGLLIKSESAEEIEKGLIKLLGDEKTLKIFGEKSREMAENKFSNVSMVKKFEAIFTRTIKEKEARD